MTGQRYNKIGRTVLQMVAQKCAVMIQIVYDGSGDWGLISVMFDICLYETMMQNVP